MPASIPSPKTAHSVDPLTFPWGEIRWLCNSEMDSEAEMTFGTVTIQPGRQNDLHMHPNCEEIIYVVSGRCNHRLGEEAHLLEPGAALRIPRGVWHCAAVLGEDPCSMVIAYSSPDRQTIFQNQSP